MRTFRGRARSLLAPAAVAAALAFVLPPISTDARHYAAVQALQFVIFAVVAPALLVLGWPGGSAWHQLAGRLARGRPEVRAAAGLLPFMALVIIWRLPAVLATLARDPALTLVELVTLLVAGSAVWLDLAGPSGLGAPSPRPLRATVAAIAMWTIWIIAYITAMSSGSLLPAWSAGDTQVAAAIMWAVPGIGFVPVIYVMITTWLAERDDPDKELDGMSAVDGYPRPPRGWRSHAS